MLETVGATTIYGVVAVIFLAVSSLLGLVFFVSKEEKFEDVVAAQRKEQEALLSSLQGTNKSGKVNKKWSKLKNKKATKKGQDEEHVDEREIDSGVDDEEPSSESVVIPPPKDEPTPTPKAQTKSKKEDKQGEQKSKEKQKKQKKTKPIVVEEEVLVTQEETVVQAAPPVVIEEVIAPPKQKQETMAAPPITSSPVAPEITQTRKGKSGKNKQTKTPTKPQEGGSGIVSANKIIADLEHSQFNPTEVQQLIDVLLAKQNENEQWKKPNQKGDPVEVLNKKLSEIDILLMDERKLAQSAALKNKELKNELQQERSQRSNLQQVAAQFAQQSKEHEGARKRLEEKHMSEMQSAQAQITRMQQLIDGASQRELHQLTEENKHLKMRANQQQQQFNEENQKLIKELNAVQQSNSSVRQEYDNTFRQLQANGEQQQKSLQDKVAYYEHELQNSKKAKNDSELALSKNLNEVKEKLLQVEGQNKALLQEVNGMKKESQTKQAEVESLQQSAPSSDEVSKLSTKLLETEAQLSQTQTSMKELLAQVEQKNSEIQSYQEDQTQTQQKLSELMSSVEQSKSNDGKQSAELTELQRIVKEKEQQLNDMNKRNEDLSSELQKAKEAPAAPTLVATPVDEEKLKLLEATLAESQKQQRELSESVDTIKKKNNDLREKNWKAMDALGKAEEETKSLEKSLEKTIFKSLKNLHPDLKLPKSKDGLEEFFQQYEKVYKEHTSEKEKAASEETETLRKENEDLQKQIDETNTTNVNVVTDEMKSENEHLKNVLGETESMLSRLQAGVDAEVAKWQTKVNDKNEELEDVKKKLTDMEETMKEHGFVQESVVEMETTLKETQQQLEQEKQETQKLKMELEETKSIFEKEAASQRNELKEKLKKTETELEEANKKVGEMKGSSGNEVNDLNAKLKKTISERDLLIREYKALKEGSAKAQEEIKKSKDEVDTASKQITEVHKKELKKLQDNITALENAAKTTGKGDKDKDKLITKLYLEIEELKEDLREERDRVIVDIETPDSEDLHKKVDALTSELQTEKESKLNLSVKLNDLEKSFQEEQSDKDKVLNLESKLKAAEAKVAELEAAQTTHIQSQIEDAMGQAAATSPGVDIGTSV